MTKQLEFFFIDIHFKSCTSLKVGALNADPLHVICPSLKERGRSEDIDGRRTITYFLSVKLFCEYFLPGSSREQKQKRSYLSRNLVLY